MKRKSLLKSSARTKRRLIQHNRDRDIDIIFARSDLNSENSNSSESSSSEIEDNFFDCIDDYNDSNSMKYSSSSSDDCESTSSSDNNDDAGNVINK